MKKDVEVFYFNCRKTSIFSYTSVSCGGRASLVPSPIIARYVVGVHARLFDMFFVFFPCFRNSVHSILEQKQMELWSREHDYVVVLLVLPLFLLRPFGRRAFPHNITDYS
jgi:hypothetical protein